MSVCARGWSAAAVCAALLIWATALPVAADPEPDGETPAGSAAPAEVLVVPGRLARELAPLAEGCAELVRLRLQALGVAVREGRRLRAELAARGPKAGTPGTIALARESGAAGLMFVDLTPRKGELELVLRYHDGASGELASSSRARGGFAQWGALRDRAIGDLGAALAIGAPSRASEGRISIEDLAAASAALAELDAGALARAWRAVEGRGGAPLQSIREQIRAAAREPRISYPERVRLLAAMGESDRAWSMIAPRAEVELEKPDADPALLEVAGEVKLARGELAHAQRFFERALERRPSSPDAALGLGAARAQAGDPAGARTALERARALAPTRVDVLERLAELPSSDPAERATRWLAAAQPAAEQLRVDKVAALLEHAEEEQASEPKLAARSFEVAAELAVRVGDHRSAAENWSEALRLGGDTPQRLLALGESQLVVGELAPAAKALGRALELAPTNATALRALGDVRLEQGELEGALGPLERALELAPTDGRTLRSLGRARLQGGDAAASLALFREAERLQPGAAEELQELAALEREHGDRDAATHVLERAVELEPADPQLHSDLARAYREAGQLEAGRRVESLALLLGGTQFQKLFPEAKPQDSAVPPSPSLDRLVQTLLEADPAVRRVAVLGVREPLDRRETWLDWLRPRVPDLAGISRELEQALAAHVEVVPSAAPVGQELFYAQALDRLHAFGADEALDASTIATLNTLLGTDALALARLERHAADAAALDRACGVEAHFLIDARLLSGRIPAQVRALTNAACLLGGTQGHGRWNVRALLLVLGLLAALAYPLLRGRGSVVVVFRLPQNTRANFSVSVTQRRRKLGQQKPTIDDARWSIREKLQSIHRSEKRLEGTSVSFHWLPARRRPVYVTVRGPLVDHHSGDLVGSFNAEKTVVVQRGRSAEVEFDMRSKDACIEVNVLSNGVRADEATVCVRGMAKSQRFARGKPVYLYLPVGSYVVVAGVADAVAELPLAIERELPQTVLIDVSDPGTQLFRGCPAAVAPYMEADFARAASALEQAGLREASQKVRALAQLARGETQAATRSLAEAGELSRAAELELQRGGDAEAARMFEQSGEHGRAAEIHERKGDKRAAALAFERAYDYERAALCYREIGDLESLVTVLEKSGDVYEAGRVACALEQWDRAIRDLQQVDRRHLHYTGACLILGEILCDRGERDLALEAFDRAMADARDDGPELAHQARYAELLEDAGRIADAIEVYNRIRRRDRSYPGARERAEALRRQLADSTQLADSSGAPRAAPGAPAPVAPGRYEIVGELGRGAMGIVYRARDTVLDRMVALKKLPESMRAHELAVRFFLREARSAAALNHPNIVTVYDAGQDGDTYFLTMECLEGVTFDGILRRNRLLSARDTCLLGVQAASGLAYAHASGIIHRDIKPSNLFYTRERVVKIMDFGLAKAVEEVRRNATVIAGTPYYMPPEQAEGDVVDRRSDLYAFGVTLFHMCTGRVPFTEGDVTYHHRHSPPPDPRELAEAIPDALAELILQLMAKDPAGRPSSADEVVARLKSIAQGLAAR